VLDVDDAILKELGELAHCHRIASAVLAVPCLPFVREREREGAPVLPERRIAPGALGMIVEHSDEAGRRPVIPREHRRLFALEALDVSDEAVEVGQRRRAAPELGLVAVVVEDRIGDRYKAVLPDHRGSFD
jgi:hypothetical protein